MWVKLKRLRPCASAMAQLDPIPGVGPSLAEALIAEIGTDRRRFPTPAHLASWAGMCPGNHESAGCPWVMRRSGRTRNGSPWLRALLVQAAHAEPDAPTGTASALIGELRAMAGWLGLERVKVERRGGLASVLRNALRA